MDEIEMVDKSHGRGKTMATIDDGFGARRTYVGQSVNSPTGTTVAYSSEIVPNSSVDFTTDKNFVGFESENKIKSYELSFILFYGIRCVVKENRMWLENLLEMCLRIWSTGLNMRVSIAQRSGDSRSAPEFSCIFSIECRSIQLPRRSWKRQEKSRQSE